MNIPLPFKTNDAVLAFCLYLAGVPEWRPPTNIYDEEMLLQRGYAGSGLNLEEAAKQEFAKKKRGHVEYWFESNELLKMLLPIYNQQQAEIAADKDKPQDIGEAMRVIMAKVAGRDPVTNEDIEPKMDECEGLLRIACLTLKTRIAYVDRSNDKAAAFLKLYKGDAPPAPTQAGDGSVTQSFQAFKLVSLFASDAVKREMGML